MYLILSNKARPNMVVDRVATCSCSAKPGPLCPQHQLGSQITLTQKSNLHTLHIVSLVLAVPVLATIHSPSSSSLMNGDVLLRGKEIETVEQLRR